MPPLQQLGQMLNSPQIRYFWARFRPAAKSKVWLPALGLVGVGVFAYEVSQRPDWQQAFRTGDRPGVNQPDRDDLAIAADIDSLPLLLNPTQKTAEGKAEERSKTNNPLLALTLPSASSLNSNSNANSNAAPSSVLFPTLNTTPKPGSAPTATASPTASSTNSSTNSPIASMVPGQPATTSAIATALATPSRRTSTYIEGQPSALASAVARYSQPTARPEMANLTPTSSPAIPTPNTSWNQPTAPLQGSAPIPTSNYDPGLPAVPYQGNNPAPTGSSYPLNSYTGLTQPNPSAAIETAPLNSGIGQPLNSGIGQPIAPLNPEAQTLPPQQDLPFTVRRSIPGRAIGGGEMGTFSNP